MPSCKSAAGFERESIFVIAKFLGGPFHGQFRSVKPDPKAADESEQGNPPLSIQVSEVRNDEIRNTTYLRRKEKVDNRWEYLCVRPQ